MKNMMAASYEGRYTLSEAKEIIKEERKEKLRSAAINFLKYMKILSVRFLGILLIAACLLMAYSQQANEDGTGFILCALIGLAVALKPELILRKEEKK